MTDERSQFENQDPPVPVVTGAPDVIYLCVGDLEHDDSFSAIEYTGEVTWCADKQGNSDIKYVRADLAARAAPAKDKEELRRFWNELNEGAAPAQPNDNKTDVIEPHPMLSPTHYCKDCGALWRQNDDFSMSLRSSHPCEACDNTPVGGQLFPLTEIPLPAIPPVSMRPFGYLKTTENDEQAARAAPAQPCGCRVGECESKPDRLCRMLQELQEGGHQ